MDRVGLYKLYCELQERNLNYIPVLLFCEELDGCGKDYSKYLDLLVEVYQNEEYLREFIFCAKLGLEYKDLEYLLLGAPQLAKLTALRKFFEAYLVSITLDTECGRRLYSQCIKVSKLLLNSDFDAGCIEVFTHFVTSRHELRAVELGHLISECMYLGIYDEQILRGIHRYYEANGRYSLGCLMKCAEFRYLFDSDYLLGVEDNVRYNLDILLYMRSYKV